jgi:hypothetical protein
VTCRSDENIHIYTNIAEVDPSWGQKRGTVNLSDPCNCNYTVVVSDIKDVSVILWGRVKVMN